MGETFPPLIWISDKFHGSPHGFQSIHGATHTDSIGPQTYWISEKNCTNLDSFDLSCISLDLGRSVQPVGLPKLVPAVPENKQNVHLESSWTLPLRLSPTEWRGSDFSWPLVAEITLRLGHLSWGKWFAIGGLHKHFQQFHRWPLWHSQDSARIKGCVHKFAPPAGFGLESAIWQQYSCRWKVNLEDVVQSPIKP